MNLSRSVAMERHAGSSGVPRISCTYEVGQLTDLVQHAGI